MAKNQKPMAINKGTTLSKVSTMTFVGMTCALVASIRNIPDVAVTGWTMIFYMFAATLLFGLPIALISGEYASMFPSGDGGPELWNTHSLGSKWGFQTSWLLWVQMFPGMVMVASVLAPMLGVGIFPPGSKEATAFGQNNANILLLVLIVYWAVTFLNMKFDMAKIGGKWGIWFMLYIPAIMIFILGIAATIKTGIDPKSTLGAFKADQLFPTGNPSSLAMFSSIIFIFTGIEMSSVYIKRLEKPVKQYTQGVFVALILMLVINLVAALVCANAVPAGQTDLNNVAQPVVLFCKVLGIPTWIGNVFGLLVFVGVMVQLSAWITGPSKTITQSARRGEYPPKFKFWKTNELNISKSVLITQASIISLCALVYLLIPGANEAFLALVNATSILYCLVYVIMAIGIVKLRKTQPDLKRAFRVGKKGNGALYTCVAILLAVIVIACVYSLLPAQSAMQKDPASAILNALLPLIISAVLFFAGLVVYKMRKPEWKTEVEKAMAAEQHNIPEPSLADTGEHPTAAMTHPGTKATTTAQKPTVLQNNTPKPPNNIQKPPQPKAS